MNEMSHLRFGVAKPKLLKFPIMSSHVAFKDDVRFCGAWRAGIGDTKYEFSKSPAEKREKNARILAVALAISEYSDIPNSLWPTVAFNCVRGSLKKLSSRSSRAWLTGPAIGDLLFCERKNDRRLKNSIQIQFSSAGSILNVRGSSEMPCCAYELKQRTELPTTTDHISEEKFNVIFIRNIYTSHAAEKTQTRPENRREPCLAICQNENMAAF